MSNTIENSHLISNEEKKDERDEREVWETMTPKAWHDSVAEKDSIFCETYEITRDLVTRTAETGSYDVIIEVGCGTGDVIGNIKTDIPRIGVDINPDFLYFCEEQYPDCTFELVDALRFVEWYKMKGFDKKYTKPLLTCVNNTLNIMPENMRGNVLEQMLTVAGDSGLCMVSYWNGNFFSHAVLNYYKKNEPLCGRFDIHQHVDWEKRVLVTPDSYSTEWMYPSEVQQLLKTYDVDVPNLEVKPMYEGKPHAYCDGLGIFVWFDQTSTSKKSEEKNDRDEREVWETMTPKAWHDSVTEKNSIFCETYEITRDLVTRTAETGYYDVVIEVGCGTGDVIGNMKTDIPRIGVDINPDFLRFCEEQHPDCEFELVDALRFVEWYNAKGFDKKYKKPLLMCVNNTLNIMPENMRGNVLEQMLTVAGDSGLCMVSYWNGNFFSHAVMNYYKKNEPLCGWFDVHQHVDFEKRVLVTPDSYSTEWMYPSEVQQLLKTYDVDVPNLEAKPKYEGKPHAYCDGLGIFVWFDQTSTSKKSEEKKDERDEREVWETMTPKAWHDSVTEKNSIFCETYEITRDLVTRTAETGCYDVVIEVGCGTGDVIGNMKTDIPRIGVDINPDFLYFCEEQYPDCTFELVDALRFVEWYNAKGFDKKYKKPLLMCVNNTLNIMPENMRGNVLEQMLTVAGDSGLCMVSYWNGTFFSHAVMNYYKKNEPLCGRFDVHQHVDWEKRVLVTPDSYSTEWMYPSEVQQLLKTYNVDVPNLEAKPKYEGKPHAYCDGLGIFVWFDQTSTSKKDERDEREVWETMTPKAWHDSVTEKNSIFCETYEITRDLVTRTAETGCYDVVIEVGCGTGDVIGNMETDIPRIGVDINPDFLRFCEEQHPDCEFELVDALRFVEWYNAKGFDKKYKKPLLMCVNNTLNIMPENMRGNVLEQMLTVAGDSGLCMVSYWNGNFFSHAVMNYYKKNEPLCGRFDVHQHVDWEKRVLVTPDSYSTEWMYPSEVQQLLRSYDVDVPNLEEKPKYDGKPHAYCDGLGIFVWFDHTSSSMAKGYYDSEDAQKFYNNIWGEDTIHIGRYDLLTKEDLETLSTVEQVQKAQELHEMSFVKLIQEKMHASHGLRMVDMGCGYGGLLRRFWSNDLVWSAVGCDISSRMCAQARSLNEAQYMSDDIKILEESYLDISVVDESADLVVSMDALLHVGPQGQQRAMQEAARILRPGGWIIFCDIMQQENVNPEEMRPIYDRIHLSEMGTIKNYETSLNECGFSNFTTDMHSSNVAEHYGRVQEVLREKGSSIGISEEYCRKADYGLEQWKTLAPKNIVWGFMMAQKTKKVDISNV